MQVAVVSRGYLGSGGRRGDRPCDACIPSPETTETVDTRAHPRCQTRRSRTHTAVTSPRSLYTVPPGWDTAVACPCLDPLASPRRSGTRRRLAECRTSTPRQWTLTHIACSSQVTTQRQRSLNKECRAPQHITAHTIIRRTRIARMTGVRARRCCWDSVLA